MTKTPGIAPERDIKGLPEVGHLLRQELEDRQRSEGLLRKSNQRLELLSDVASQLLMSTEPQKIVNALCQKVLAFLDCHAFFNFLVDEQRGCLHLNTCGGIPEETAQSIEWLEYGVAVCGCAARDGCRIVAEHIPITPDPRTELVKSFGILAYACHPLLAQGKVLGTLSFGSRTKSSFSADDLSLMKAVTDHIAIAMERLIVQEQLKKAKEAAEDANRAKDQFLATVSHELRTPLNAILGWAQLMRLGVLSEAEQREAIEKIEQNGKAQAALVEDVLDISRIINGKLRVEKQPVNLAGVIQAAIDAIRPMAEGKGIGLESRLEHSTAQVLGDFTRLQQVIWNLLSNAVKFTPEGGRILLSLEQADWEAVVQVSDTGKGIAPEFMPQLFERFRQADSSSTRHYSGLGLGLAIVRYIIEAHGGSIVAESQGVGQGATFTVKLPVQAGSGGMRAEAARSGAEEYRPSLAGVRVLGVDDEPSAREVLERILSASDAQVKMAASASEALEVLRHWRPDVLVSDLAMPARDGYWLIEQVRALSAEQGGGTPAVALTAYASIDDRARSLAAGFDMHLAKPVGALELASTVAALNRRKRPG